MSAKIIIAGDLCLQDRTAAMSLEELCACHKSIVHVTESADYAIVNMECAILPEGEAKPISKAGVALRNSVKTIDFIKNLGFDGVTLANNHFADYGEESVVYAMEQLKERHVDYVGAGMNAAEAKRILYKKIKDATFAFINACEHEFTVATDTQAGCNPLNPIGLSYDIKEAKKKADYVIVIIHGGHEEYQLPSPRMQDTYRFFVDMSADAVVNHHQHCYSGYELYNGKPIIYGLGNFSFDENGLRKDIWNEGYMASLTFGKTISLELIPYVQNDEQMGVQLLDGKRVEEFEVRIKELNAIIANPKRLNEAWKAMAEQRREEYMSPLKPYQYPLLVKLAKHHLLPKKLIAKLLPEYMTENRRLFMKSYFQCESHRDIMNELLKL